MQTTPNRAQDLQRVVGKIFQLQSLPDSVIRIQQTLNNANSTAEDVGREIAKDPAFSAQVLKLVNSGFYGFSHPITGIPHATVLLGFNVMKTLVVSASVLNLMTQSIQGLWEHSLATARTCALLARTLGVDDPEDISAVGLLHDIGKMVLAQYLKEDFGKIVTLVRTLDMLFFEAEVQVLGVSHADIAQWLLQRWKLPAETVEPIAHHHHFLRTSPHAVRTAILHVADILVRAQGVGSGGDQRIPAVDHQALTALRMNAGHLPNLMDEMMIELYDLAC